MSTNDDTPDDPSAMFDARKLADRQPWPDGFHPDGKAAVKGESTYAYPKFFDSTDGLATRGKATLSFQHIASGQRTYFKAFITSFTESYKLDWASESVFGRTDPIYLYKQTTRQMTLGFKIPASMPSEAFQNLARLQRLIQTFYPNYASIGNATSIAQSPLCRVEVLNLTPSRTSPAQTFNAQGRGTKGVLCVIQNCNINHNIENGEGGVYEVQGGAYMPKFIEVTLDLSILNEESLGWGRSSFSDPYFPYGINMEDSEGARPTTPQRAEFENSGMSAAGANFPSPLQTSRRELNDPNSATNRAIAAELERQQVYDEAEARYGGIFGDLLETRDQRRADRLHNRARRQGVRFTSQEDLHSDRAQRFAQNASDALARRSEIQARLAHAGSFIDEID